MKKIPMSIEARANLFQTELIKVGIGFQQAQKVAKLLAENRPEEQLTKEENQLIQEACTQWLAQRNRENFISQVLNEAQGLDINDSHKSFKR